MVLPTSTIHRRQRFLLQLLATIFVLSVTIGCKSEASSPPETDTPVQVGAAIDRPPFPPELTFERLNLEAGLSQSGVYAIAQDAQGFLWIATEDGLNRYDGYTFEVFRPKPDDPTSLTDGFVQALLVDHADQLWIGTNSGLDRYDAPTGAFIHVADDTVLGSADILTLFESDDGQLWIGTADDGLLVLDSGRQQNVIIATADGSTPLNIQALVQDVQGNLWIGAEHGLYRFDEAASQLKQLLQEDVYALYAAADGLLWVGTSDRVLVVDPAREPLTIRHTWRHDPDDLRTLTSGEVRVIRADRAGTVWIGMTGGLNRVSADGQHLIRYEHDPADDTTIGVPYVRSIFEDREGNLWIGTYGGGLAKAAAGAQPFQLLLAGMGVTGMVEQPAGTLWAGTLDDGLLRVDLASGDFESFAHDPANPASLISNHVWDVAVDGRGTVWVGTGGGLSRLDPPYAAFTHYVHTADDRSLSHDHVWTLLIDRAGTLWVGTERGLDRFDATTDTFVRLELDASAATSARSWTVTALFEDTTGALWIGTFNSGLYRRDPASNNFTHYAPDATNPAALSHEAIVYVGEDGVGNVWVGTYGGGLNRLDRQSDRFNHFSSADGLPNDVVYSMLPDDAGGFWLSTNRGLAHFDPRAITFENYTVEDGLQSNEFNLNAALTSSAGELYFGGIDGVTAFVPTAIGRNPYVTPVVLTRVTQGGDAAPLDAAAPQATTLTLTWPQNFFEFEFAALSYAQPSANQYAYKLDGFDEQWNDNGARRFGRYTNLPGGRYTLYIRGSNGDGVWNEAGTALAVVVVPPLWERPWVQAIFVVTLLATVATAYGMHMRSVEMRNQALEAEVAARTQDLVGLNAIGTVVSRTLDLQETLDAALVKSAEVLACEAGGIFLLPPGQSTPETHLSLAAHYGLTPHLVSHIDNLLVGEGFSGHVVQTGEAILANDLASDSRLTRRDLVTAGFRALAVTPLLVRKRIIGTFFVLTQRPRQFGERDRTLLAAIGGQVGVAIENARLYEQAQTGAILAERQRIARELHDSVTQALYGVTLYTRAASGQLAQGDAVRAAAHLEQVRATAQDALAEMRLLIHELRPPLLAEEGLAAALQARLQAVEGRAGLQTSFKLSAAPDVDADQRLPKAIEQGLYRIGQEALNNALKHARATCITVRLRFDPTAVILAIEDDGTGFDTDAAQRSGGSGLSGMAQRAAEMNGSLTIDATQDHGTRIRVEVPL